VAFLPEPVEVELQFRKESARKTASQKVWADAWLLAVASSAGGQLITFDRALASRGAHCLLTE
jgi:predicted nucleic acid-binding protein